MPHWELKERVIEGGSEVEKDVKGKGGSKRRRKEQDWEGWR